MTEVIHTWADVVGMFDENDGAALQDAVKLCPPGTSHVELGAWCGRSLAAACEALPVGVVAYSYDNYKEDSQATGGAGKTPREAMALREEVVSHYRQLGKGITTVLGESSASGKLYSGPRVASLLIDDHHSAEQVEANLLAWLPHTAPECTVLLHDYWHPPYGIATTAQRILPSCGFRFIETRGGLGIWRRP